MAAPTPMPEPGTRAPGPRPQRALHVYAGNLYGGIETFLVTLARHGASVPGYAQAFALCFEGRLADELRAAGAEVHMLGAVRVRRPLTVLRARRRLAGLLRRGRFDVLVTHGAWATATLGPAARTAGVPLVLYVHNAALDDWLDRWARRQRPDLAVCNSAYTASTLAARWSGPAEVTPYPVALRPASAPREETRRALGAGDAVVIVQVSRMEWWKGQRLHLDALARLRDHPGWVCWMVGGAQRPAEARYLEGLRARARSLGIADRVRFLGQRRDVPDLLAAADVHCQPNEGPEPFGITFVEGLAAGLPVVATRMGGALEIVDDTCGLLVPPEPDAVAAALRRLVDDPALRARLGAAGAERARTAFAPEARVADLAAILRRHLQGGPGPAPTRPVAAP